MGLFTPSRRPKLKGSRIFALFLFTFFIVLSVYLYIAIGGFSSPDITRVTAPSYKLYGEKFAGYAESKEYSHRFDKFEKLLASDSVEGVTAEFVMSIAMKKRDSTYSFVGLIRTDGKEGLGSYQVYEVPEREVLQATIISHRAFGPVRAYAELEEYAREHDLEIRMQDALEISPSIDSIIVQVPVVE